jgi:hypothetical protein
MRSILIATVAALAFAVSAHAGGYTLDAKGKCHGPDGKYVVTSLCKTPPAGPYKLDAKGKCHAANGQYVATALCHR